MSNLLDAIKLASDASDMNKEAGVASKAVSKAKDLIAHGRAKVTGKMTKKQKILRALAAAGIVGGAAGGAALVNKKASAEPEISDFELAKIAAYELGCEALEKLAFAEQLYDEAEYVDQVYVKQAAEAEDIDLDSDGSALDAFLQELEAEDSEDESEDE